MAAAAATVLASAKTVIPAAATIAAAKLIRFFFKAAFNIFPLPQLYHKAALR